jgi:phospholipase D-like protein/putative oligomerization/nucleic acid binding protein
VDVVVLSLGEFLWSLLVIFFMVTYFMMLFHVIFDVFRRDDASGWTKALWLIFLFILPFIGLISYMVINARGMAERTGAYATDRAGYGYQGTAESTPTAEIEKAKQLLDAGAITAQEYDRIKAKALS